MRGGPTLKVQLYLIFFISVVGGQTVKPRQRSAFAKLITRIVVFGTITAVIYWTVKLFALELSSTEILKSKISMYSFVSIIRTS